MSTHRPDFGLALAAGLLISAVLHGVLFLLDPALHVPGASDRARAMHLVALESEPPPPPAPDVKVPEAPAPVFQPGPPVVTIGQPPDVKPTYIPHDIPPQLQNPAHVQELLQSLYPVGYRSQGIGGVVVLWLYIDHHGDVTRVQVRTPSRHDSLTLAAKSVARAMEFRPAFNHDRAVGVWVSQPIRFVALPASSQQSSISPVVDTLRADTGGGSGSAGAGRKSSSGPGATSESGPRDP